MIRSKTSQLCAQCSASWISLPFFPPPDIMDVKKHTTWNVSIIAIPFKTKIPHLSFKLLPAPPIQPTLEQCYHYHYTISKGNFWEEQVVVVHFKMQNVDSKVITPPLKNEGDPSIPKMLWTLLWVPGKSDMYFSSNML